MKLRSMSVPLLGLLVLSVITLLLRASLLPQSLATAGALCPRPAPGQFSCLASVKLDASGKPLVSVAPSGSSPAVWHHVYRVGSQASRPTTIGIITAYDNPRILADLATFNLAYGLPATPACASRAQPNCLEKLDQLGGTNYPRANPGWALETALDVETVHGMCQNCHIVLVEARTPDMANLIAAVDVAVARGATIISNSYGGAEFSTETGVDSHFYRAGVLFTASSGDSGYGVSYPAASPYVLAVGGTTLSLSGGGRRTETAWSGSGSGCSRYEPKPTWQHDPGCPNRTVADIAAAADPATGAAVFSSTPFQGKSGWFTLGGTSLSSPLVAGMAAVSGNAGIAQLYSHLGTSALYDVSLGSNGTCPAAKHYLCHATAGYDGPTGVGVPTSQAF